jgi:ribosomal protein L37AE/L43A
VEDDMELIKEIERRRQKNGQLERWGIFKCPICGKHVEKRLQPGIYANACSISCGRAFASLKEKKPQKKHLKYVNNWENSQPQECVGCGYWETDGCKFSRVHGFTRTGYLKGRTCREAGIYTKKITRVNVKPVIPKG